MKPESISVSKMHIAHDVRVKERLLRVRLADFDNDIAGIAEASIISSGGNKYLVKAGCTPVSSLIVIEGFNSL